MEIDIKTLETATQYIFQHIKDKGIKSIEIEEDFYWNINSQEKYDSYNEPKDLDLGQLSDDWLEIKKIAFREKQPISYSLVWLAALYKILGEKIVG
jgi:hypothetical protein